MRASHRETVGSHFELRDDMGLSPAAAAQPQGEGGTPSRGRNAAAGLAPAAAAAQSGGEGPGASRGKRAQGGRGARAEDLSGPTSAYKGCGLPPAPRILPREEHKESLRKVNNFSRGAGPDQLEDTIRPAAEVRTLWREAKESALKLLTGIEQGGVWAWARGCPASVRLRKARDAVEGTIAKDRFLSAYELNPVAATTATAVVDLAGLERFANLRSQVEEVHEGACRLRRLLDEEGADIS